MNPPGIKSCVEQSGDDRPVPSQPVVQVVRIIRHTDAVKMFKWLKVSDDAFFDLLQRLFEGGFKALSSPTRTALRNN